MRFLPQLVTSRLKCWYCLQIGRAMSRLLNAFCGGEGDTTFSAYSYYLLIKNSMWGKIRVAVIDAVLGDNHCFASYVWHKERRLFDTDG